MCELVSRYPRYLVKSWMTPLYVCQICHCCIHEERSCGWNWPSALASRLSTLEYSRNSCVNRFFPFEGLRTKASIIINELSELKIHISSFFTYGTQLSIMLWPQTTQVRGFAPNFPVSLKCVECTIPQPQPKSDAFSAYCVAGSLDIHECTGNYNYVTIATWLGVTLRHCHVQEAIPFSDLFKWVCL